MEKKTKLKISGIAKKSIQNIERAKTQSKNSVIIEREKSKNMEPNKYPNNPPRTEKNVDMKKIFR